MKEQNFKNHRRYAPLYHFVLLGLDGAIIALAVYNMLQALSRNSGRIQAAMFILMALALTICSYLARHFSVKVQDRAIRAEENLRYFAMTGKLLDNRLTMGQIVALRFASDAEFVALSEHVVKENLSNKDIKQAIKNWKADNHRA